MKITRCDVDHVYPVSLQSVKNWALHMQVVRSTNSVIEIDQPTNKASVLRVTSVFPVQILWGILFTVKDHIIKLHQHSILQDIYGANF